MSRKIALAGIGKIARDQHIPAIYASPDWQLAATVSRHASIDGVASFEDFDVFLKERGDIEVVSLCTPPGPRFDYAAKAIGAGRHVMLEKPPGATLSECEVLVDMARRAGVTLYANWHSREAAQVDAAQKWLSDKAVRTFRIVWKEDVRRWHPGQSWIWEPAGMGVFDPGINALSIMTAILPDPVHLREGELQVPANCQTPIAASLVFRHPEGAEVTAEFDFLQQGEQIWSIEAETDAGTMLLFEGGARLAINGREVVSSQGPALSGEYPRLYANLARLVSEQAIDVDLAPMRHVADALALSRRRTVEPFYDQEAESGEQS